MFGLKVWPWKGLFLCCKESTPVQFIPFVNFLYVASYIRHEDFLLLLRPPSSSVTLVLPPLDSETGWTGELWSNRILLILEN